MLILQTIGRVGHQKRIRKLVRLICYPSAVHIVVWEECYWRWRRLSEIIFESLGDGADGAESLRSSVWQEVCFVLSSDLLSQSLNISIPHRSIFSNGKTLPYIWLPSVVPVSKRMWI